MYNFCTALVTGAASLPHDHKHGHLVKSQRNEAKFGRDFEDFSFSFCSLQKNRGNRPEFGRLAMSINTDGLENSEWPI
jgi:hypothetical protein